MINQKFPKSNIGKPILIASHPRSGTHLTIDLLRKQFPECMSWKKRGEPNSKLYFALESIDDSNCFSEKMLQDILSRSKRPLIKTHYYPNLNKLARIQPEIKNWIKEEADIFYIVRDGRDVICSFYSFMQTFNPEAHCSLSQFIRNQNQSNNPVKGWANHVKQWIAEPNVNILRFEDIVNYPYETIAKISSLLSLNPLYLEPLLPKSFKNIWESRWARLMRKKPESTAILSPNSLNWKRSFNQEDRQFFHEQAGDVLIKFGYEKSDDWIFDNIAYKKSEF